MAKRLDGGQVKSTDVAISFAAQSAVRKIPTAGWKKLQVASIGSFGASIEKGTRQILGQSRLAPKGSITGLTSPFSFDTDITMENLFDFTGAFLYTRVLNLEAQKIGVSSLTANGINVATGLTNEQIKVIKPNSLMQIRGAGNNDNNKIVVVGGTAPALNDTDFDLTAAALIPESGDFEISFAGYRVSGTPALTWTFSAGQKTITLNRTGLGTVLEGLNLHVGQTVHLGTPNEAGTDYVNVPNKAGPEPLFGSARVRSMSANQIVLDGLSDNLLAAPVAGAIGTVDIVFGTFARTVDISDPDYCEFAYTFEQEIIGLGDGTEGDTSTSYEYTHTQYPNTLDISLAQGSVGATGSFGFSGADTLPPTTTRRPGAVNGISPTRNSAFSPVADLARLKISGVDDEGLTTDFNSLTLNINNNVTPQTVLGYLGAKYQNVGNLEIGLTADVLFTSPNIPRAIRENRTVNFITAMQNDDGAVYYDIPSATLSDGNRTYPVNESITISANLIAHEDTFFGNTGLMVSTIPITLIPITQEEV